MTPTLEARLEEWLDELSGYRPILDDPRRDLLHETMVALREKDTRIKELEHDVAALTRELATELRRP